MNIGSMSNNYIIPYSGVSRVTPVNADNTVDTSTKVKPVECQTCKNREYVDGSNEPDVSFKTPGKIAAGESYAKVSAHEREHVVCPECGRTYVAGGETTTQIQYSESNPYEKNRKQAEAGFLIGNNFDAIS